MSSAFETRTLLGEVLVLGLEDWVSDEWFYSVASGLVDDPGLRKLLTYGALCEALLKDLMVAGDVEGHFRQWPGRPAEWLEMIFHRLEDAGGKPSGFATGGWLSNTAKGDALAREQLKLASITEQGG